MALEDILGWKSDRKFTSEVTPEQDGAQVNIVGNAYKIRKVGNNLAFVVLRDRSGEVQLTVLRKNNPELFESIDDLTPETAIAVSGTVSATEKANAGVEIIPDELYVMSQAETPLPLSTSDSVNTSPETRFDNRFLDLRDNKRSLILQTLSTVTGAMADYCRDNGFVEIHSAKLMSTASETGAELFEVSNYFGKSAFLAQSPQFYKQMAIAAGLDRVFEIGPVFRANPSHTSRHDTEFTMFDAELGWIDSHEDVMKFEEDWLSYVIDEVKRNHGEEIREHFDIDIVVPTTPFPRLSLKAAKSILESKGFNVDYEGDLTRDEEKALGEYISETQGHDFLFVTDYPISVRPFYHMRQDDPNFTRSFDLLWNGLEITTGAQREHRYDQIMTQVHENEMDPEPMQWYLDMFKSGVPPHGGFGLSPTRVVVKLLDLPHVREATLNYRNPDRLTP